MSTPYTHADQANDALQTSPAHAAAVAILGSLPLAMLRQVADLNYVEESNRTRMVRALADAVHVA